MRSHLPSLVITCCLVLPMGAFGCQREGGGSVPPQPAASSEIGTPPGEVPSDCVAACIQARQMEAVSIEMIESSCREQCANDPKAY